MWIGDVPPELQDLTPGEQRMIAPYNSFCTLLVLGAGRRKGGQYGLTRGVCHLLNDVASKAKILPRAPDKLGFVTIVVERVPGPAQSADQGSSDVKAPSTYRPYLIRPEKVRAALLWLKEHNFHYADIDLSFDELDKWAQEELPVVRLTEEQYAPINKARVAAELKAQQASPPSTAEDDDEDPDREVFLEDSGVSEMLRQTTILSDLLAPASDPVDAGACSSSFFAFPLSVVLFLSYTTPSTSFDAFCCIFACFICLCSFYPP